MTTIKLKNGSGAPLAGDLVVGEPALDLTNKRLYTEDSGGTVIEVGTNPTSVTTGAITSTGIDVTGTVTADSVGIGAAGLYFNDGGTKDLIPYSLTANDTVDNSISLGISSKRFKDLHLSGTAYVATSVGIGTSSPDYLLHLEKAGGVMAQLKATDSNQAYMKFVNSTTGDGAFTDGLLLGVDSDESVVLWNYEATATRFATGGTERMRIDSSGNVGIGTSSPSSVLHLSTSNDPQITLTDTGFGASADITGSNGNLRLNSQTATIFDMADSEVMRIDSSGNLLVGTTDDVVQTNSGTGNGGIVLRNNNYVAVASDGSAALELNRLASDGEIANFRKDGTTVGSIGTSGFLYLAGGSSGGTHAGIRFINDQSIRPCASDGSNLDNTLDLGATTTRFKNLYLSGQTFGGDGAANVPSYAFGNDTNMGMYRAGNNIIGFSTSSAERMRIDGSGNLLVGCTSAGASNGVTLHSSGYIQPRTNTGIPAIYADREGSDGSIIELRKDGTAVGSIGSRAGNLFTTYTSNGYGLTGTATSNAVIPSFNGATSDNAVDLGGVAVRFDDIYATNGTIQTSDRNEKQDIEALSDAEQRVAVAAKGLLRKFRWIDSVEEKGDDARIHFGIIAQDLQDAFTAEGLDAGRYAMFISSTWWESTEVIPAVEAQEAVVDEEGNVVEEAVEAQEERTVVHTHDTAEEAPEGSVERTRLGVRYSELLAFIIAAI